MTDVDRLIICRAMLLDIRQRRQSVEMLRKTVGEMPECLDEVRRMVTAASGALAALQCRFPTLMGEAVAVLTRLPRDEREILLLYYVMGFSQTEIAERTHYHYRSVQRKRRAALEKLGSEGGTCA